MRTTIAGGCRSRILRSAIWRGSRGRSSSAWAQTSQVDARRHSPCHRASIGCALTCLLYAALSGQKEYSALARRQRDFILGCNPYGVSCVIGAGKRYPRYPHHQVANIENLELKGAVVGGPTSASIYQGEDIA